MCTVYLSNNGCCNGPGRAVRGNTQNVIMTDYAKWDKMAAMLADSDDDDEVVSSPRHVCAIRLGRLGVCVPYPSSAILPCLVPFPAREQAAGVAGAHMTRGTMS